MKVRRCHFQQLGCSSSATDSMQVNASSRAATAGEGGNGLQVSMSHCPHARLAPSAPVGGPLAFGPGSLPDTTFRVQRQLRRVSEGNRPVSVIDNQTNGYMPRRSSLYLCILSTEMHLHHLMDQVVDPA